MMVLFAICLRIFLAKDDQSPRTSMTRGIKTAPALSTSEKCLASLKASPCRPAAPAVIARGDAGYTRKYQLCRVAIREIRMEDVTWFISGLAGCTLFSFHRLIVKQEGFIDNITNSIVPSDPERVVTTTEGVISTGAND